MEQRSFFLFELKFLPSFMEELDSISWFYIHNWVK